MAMSELVAVRRVTVIADSVLENMLLDQFVRLGARGYTVFDCRGKGEHAILENTFSRVSRVRIETIVQPAVAKAILDYLHTPTFASHAVTACIETVEVSPEDRF
jgi:hypothetical protein